MSPATVNRDLSCLRQILGTPRVHSSAAEWSSYMRRERTLSFDVERRYLKVATPVLRDVLVSERAKLSAWIFWDHR